VFSAKGALSSQPEATPQEKVQHKMLALKTRFNRPTNNLCGTDYVLNRAFSADAMVCWRILGRCLRLR
jgi:hypothetical protein